MQKLTDDQKVQIYAAALSGVVAKNHLNLQTPEYYVGLAENLGNALIKKLESGNTTESVNDENGH